MLCHYKEVGERTGVQKGNKVLVVWGACEPEAQTKHSLAIQSKPAHTMAFIKRASSAVF